MKLPGILAAFLSFVLSCPLWLSGQAASSPSTPAAAPEVNPVQGYLSATRYANQYFGFAFDLPPDAQLEPVRQPVARDGRILILQLAGPSPAYAAVSIVAFPVGGKTSPDSKAILRKALEQELFHGVEELHGLSKTTLAGHLFYYFETRRGVEQHVAFAANLEGYAVVTFLEANNEKVVKELETAFQHLMFIAPAKVREVAGADAQEYEGPALSSRRLAQLQADPPADHIDPGKLTGNFYENQALGFRYRIQSGWTLEAEGAVQPAVERSRNRSYDDPWIGAGERELMKVCSRTLFSAWAKPPGENGQLSYDDFGEVTVSAVSTACFPGMRFPATLADHRAIQDFLAQLRLTHPMLQSMRDARAFTSGGNVVVFLHGNIAFQVPDDKLSRRLSIAMAITSRRGYFLTWFFAAPHDSELKELLDEKIAFDTGPLTKEASSAKPGGGDLTPASATSAAPAPEATATSAPQESSEPAPSASAGSPPEASSASAGNGSLTGTMQQQDAPATSAASPPSLIRPGEATPDQQVKGQPLPQKH